MVRLEPLEGRDYRRIVEWIDSPDLLTQWGGMPFDYPLTVEQLRAHFDTADDEPTRLGFKAVPDASRSSSPPSTRSGDGGQDRMIGTLELGRIDRENDSAAICRVFVDPAERNRGVGAEMLREALAIGFDDLDLHRIELRVFAFNEPAISCYETVGFSREGVHRDSHRQGEEYWSTVQMSMLDDEWRRIVDE